MLQFLSTFFVPSGKLHHISVTLVCSHMAVAPLQHSLPCGLCLRLCSREVRLSLLSIRGTNCTVPQLQLIPFLWEVISPFFLTLLSRESLSSVNRSILFPHSLCTHKSFIFLEAV